MKLRPKANVALFTGIFVGLISATAVVADEIKTCPVYKTCTQTSVRSTNGGHSDLVYRIQSCGLGTTCFGAGADRTHCEPACTCVTTDEPCAP